jgi:hypothetical protein
VKSGALKARKAIPADIRDAWPWGTSYREAFERWLLRSATDEHAMNLIEVACKAICTEQGRSPGDRMSE